MLNSPRRAGFTLVELSIVLVIIGLLVGGVLAGKNLIHGAEIRRVITDINNYKSATIQFKQQYRYLGQCFLAARDLKTSLRPPPHAFAGARSLPRAQENLCRTPHNSSPRMSSCPRTDCTSAPAVRPR